MASVISGDANVSAAEFGYLDGVTSALQTQLDAKLNLAGGKILQIVRATDSTERSTTSLTFVDASLSVTITPQKSDSAILVMHTLLPRSQTTSDTVTQASYIITDNSNNALSAAENGLLQMTQAGTGTITLSAPIVVIGYSTPATTSATTYKARFKAGTGTAAIRNNVMTGQLYAIEVSA